MSVIKQNLQQKLKSKQKTAMILLNKIYLGDTTYGAMWNKIINAAKIFIVSSRKFIKDDCFTKASAITYTIILSLVPALTVVLTIYSVYYGVGENRKELFDKILHLISEYNIKVNIDPIFETILGLIDNAGKIGGISALLIIFSATAMLRSLEKSFNNIWKVKKGRPILLKIVYYWSALTLGPIMLAAGMAAATLVFTLLSSPNYNAAYIADAGQLWVVGDKSTVLASGTRNLDLSDMSVDSGKIDFDNQREYKYESPEKAFVEQEGRIEPSELKEEKFRDIQFIGRKGWIVGSNGIMLYTDNGGITWLIRKFDIFNFNAIHMMDENKGFIAADKGNILTTTNGGQTWNVETWEGRPNFTKIAFHKDRGIITGSRGIILQTYDKGKHWQIHRITAAKQKNRYVNLNGALFVNDKQIWLLGSEGVLLFSDDNGRNWIPKKFKGYNYHSSYIFNSNELLIGGNRGGLIRTKNGGVSWTAEHLPIQGINAIISMDNRLLTFGDSGTIMESYDKGETWQVIKKGENFGYTIINFLAPFVFIWLLFLPAYITLPNIKVPFKAAGLGAAFTGAVWVIFILLFIIYIKQFAYGTFAVYGTLAGIPLFLLMIYASSLIILFGAEVAYTIMYPETYRNLSNAFKEKKELLVYNGISLLQYIYEKFEKGGGSTSQKELQKAIAGTPEEINVYIQLFLNENLIQLDAESGYAPADNSVNVSINNIIDLVMRISFELPAISGKSSYRLLMSKIFHDISEYRKKVVGNLTLRDLIDNR